MAGEKLPLINVEPSIVCCWNCHGVFKCGRAWDPVQAERVYTEEKLGEEQSYHSVNQPAAGYVLCKDCKEKRR